MSIRDFSAKLRELSRVVAMRIAAEAAPILSGLVEETTSSSADAFGVSWSPGADGRSVTLRKSGAMLSALRYVAIGTRLRISLTTRYAKFQLGRRPVAPMQGEALPTAYAEALAETSRRVLAEALR